MHLSNFLGKNPTIPKKKKDVSKNQGYEFMAQSIRLSSNPAKK